MPTSTSASKFAGPALYCGLVTCLTSFCLGYAIGAPNIIESSIRGLPGGQCGSEHVLPYSIQHGFPNCFYFSDIFWGFVVGSYCIGACAGGLAGGVIQTRLGRVKGMMITDFILIFGSTVLGLSFHQSQIVIGRIIIGFGCGLVGVIAPTYLGEIASIQTRGILGSLHQLFLVFGLLVSNLAGIAWSSPPGWRITLALNGLPAILQLCLLSTILESPSYLLSKGKVDKARENLYILRKGFESKVVQAEFDGMVALLHSAVTSDSKETAPNKSVLNASDAADTQMPATGMPHSGKCQRLVLVGVVIHFLQQGSGINGLVYYSTSILSKVFAAGNAKYITVGNSFCSLLSTLLAVYLVDRINRRPLLVLSLTGVGVSAILLTIGSYLDVGGLVMVAVFLYVTTFCIGMGPIPWLIISELLPAHAVSSGSVLATTVNWVTNFIIGLIFPTLTKSMGNATFLLFGSISFIGAGFVWWQVPETRNRTIEQVMEEMAQK
ncbi:hypothetical protein BG004_003991 [Podila humilis]|nr:hypothetical protein BG004_003991 [Podila humilis]